MDQQVWYFGKFIGFRFTVEWILMIKWILREYIFVLQLRNGLLLLRLAKWIGSLLIVYFSFFSYENELFFLEVCEWPPISPLKINSWPAQSHDFGNKALLLLL